MNPQLGYQSRPQPRPENHVLSVRQEPETARVIVRGKEKDRKPIDPPPVVQMRVYDDYNATCSYLHNPYYFCVATLWEPEEDQAFRVEDPLGPPPLTGQLVSSLHRLKDYDNTEQGFFVFGDLSAGVMGRFRLNFAVYEYKPRHGNVQFLKAINSRVFEVSSPKDWEGVRESTALSRSFADQGVRLRLRKESRNSNKRAFPQQAVPSVPQTPLRPLPSQNESYGSISSHESEPAFKRSRSFAANPAQGYMASSSQGWQPGAFASVGSHHGAYSQVGGYEPQYSAQPSQYSAMGGNTYASYPGIGASHRPPGESPSYMSPYSAAPSQMQSQYRSLPPTQQQSSRPSSGYPPTTSGYISPSGSVYSNQSYASMSTGYSGQSGAYSGQAQPYSQYGQPPGGQQHHSFGYSNAPTNPSSYSMSSGQPGEYRQGSAHTSPRGDEMSRPMANPSATPHLNPIQKFEAQVAERPAASRSDSSGPHQPQSSYD